MRTCWARPLDPSNLGGVTPLPRLAALTAPLALATALATVPGVAAAPASPRVAAAAAPVGPAAAPHADSVLVISVDSLTPKAIKRLGPEGAPTLHRIMAEGASTLNARTEVESTVTLPNHTGMVTGRRVDDDTGGHGVTWNDDRPEPSTVQEAAGEDVESVFTAVDDAGGSTALFASKTKFSLWTRSWPDAIDRSVIQLRNPRLVRVVRKDLKRHDRDLRFLHLSRPDDVGHAHGVMSKEYLQAVRLVDTLVRRVLATVAAEPSLRQRLTVILTSDHGGKGTSHSDASLRANYRIPFMVLGPHVPAGADLYEMNDDYADPGRTQPAYDAERQPVRNGAVANLALELLGLPALPGSEHDAAQDLDVTAPTE